MPSLITYKSKTGFTKRYAEYMAEKLGGDCLPFEKISASDMEKYTTVIYGGGFYAGAVNGLKKAISTFEDSSAQNLVLFAVGATPNKAENQTTQAWNNNLTPEQREKYPHFYMQGGLSYEKMSLPSKTAMEVFAKVVNKKAKTATDTYTKEMAEMVGHSYDIWDAKYAQPLIDTVIKLEALK